VPGTELSTLPSDAITGEEWRQINRFQECRYERLRCRLGHTWIAVTQGLIDEDEGEQCRLIRRVFMRTILAHIRVQAARAGHLDPRTGAVCFVQRFGSALNLNLHFHALVLDGVFTRDPRGEACFHSLPEISEQDAERLLEKIRTRISAALRRRGLLPPEDDLDDSLAPEAPLFAACQAASVSGLIALGPQAGRRVSRLGRDPLLARLSTASPDSATFDGFTLHNRVCIAARDRSRLERLCRYVSRPPLANERLSLREDGRLSVKLRRAFRDGYASHYTSSIR